MGICEGSTSIHEYSMSFQGVLLKLQEPHQEFFTKLYRSSFQEHLGCNSCEFLVYAILYDELVIRQKGLKVP